MSTQHPQEGALGPESREELVGGAPGTACGLRARHVIWGLRGPLSAPRGRLRAGGQGVPSTPHPVPLEPPSCLLDGVGRGQSSGVLLVTRPPGDFNALFSALHSLYHFLSSGHF